MHNNKKRQKNTALGEMDILLFVISLNDESLVHSKIV